ncbi:hypothetical protein [Streptomyces sp. NPDC001250]|uniref:hypothetical protein n=1 Tax=unclassified Streptomyces TaxID=2593676 RepID=UPI003318917E
MASFLTELGKWFAEKWFALLVLPGLVFVVVASGAVVLGQRRWADVGRIPADVHRIHAAAGQHDATTVVLLSCGVLSGSVAAGLLAQGLGHAVARLWLGEWWPASLARQLIARRRRRWSNAQRRYEDALRARARQRDDPELETAQLNAARNRISLARPVRPTWIGDRIAAVDRRVFENYDLDLSSAWPRLWLIVPQTTRDELGSAREGFDSAARLAGWSVLYLVLACWWWPAALIALVGGTAALIRGRAGIDAFAQLVESAVDVHGRDLAEALGIPCPGQLEPAVGLQITRALRKRT